MQQDLIHDWNRAGDAPEAERPSVLMLDDETLRDGLQSPSVVDPPIEAKVRILHLMEALGIEYMGIEEGCRGASVVMIMNNHRRFAKLPIGELVESMSSPGYLYDPWRFYSAQDVRHRKGVDYGSLST